MLMLKINDKLNGIANLQVFSSRGRVLISRDEVVVNGAIVLIEVGVNRGLVCLSRSEVGVKLGVMFAPDLPRLSSE